MDKKTGIYKITSPGGHVYIGKAKDIEKRWISHKRKEDRPGDLCLSFEEYGYENHKFEIIFECHEDDLFESELFFIRAYRKYEGLINTVTQDRYWHMRERGVYKSFEQYSNLHHNNEIMKTYKFYCLVCGGRFPSTRHDAVMCKKICRSNLKQMILKYAHLAAAIDNDKKDEKKPEEKNKVKVPIILNYCIVCGQKFEMDLKDTSRKSMDRKITCSKVCLEALVHCKGHSMDTRHLTPSEEEEMDIKIKTIRGDYTPRGILSRITHREESKEQREFLEWKKSKEESKKTDNVEPKKEEVKSEEPKPVDTEKKDNNTEIKK